MFQAVFLFGSKLVVLALPQPQISIWPIYTIILYINLNASIPSDQLKASVSAQNLFNKILKKFYKFMLKFNPFFEMSKFLIPTRDS